jgi:uncharacterized protein DUF5995
VGEVGCRVIVAGAPGSAPVNPFVELGERMEALSAPLAQDDGVRSFNELYLAVTKAVGAEYDDGVFEDPEFFSRLAPLFANLYFDAIEADAAKREVSRVWVPLFERRADARIAPLQFAIAGMNAHINHDLSLALVAATRELGYELEIDSPHHRDHMRVNATLARVMQEVKDDFETGILPAVDHALGSADDLIANWSIETARNNAWTQAQVLVALDGVPFVRERYLLSLSRNVALASRLLLVRTS